MTEGSGVNVVPTQPLCPSYPTPLLPDDEVWLRHWSSGGALPPLTVPLTKIMLRNTFPLVALEDFNLAHNSGKMHNAGKFFFTVHGWEKLKTKPT